LFAETSILFSQNTTGGDGDYTCQWTANNIIISNSCNNFNYIFKKEGTYTLVLKVVDNSNNIDSVSTQLLINKKPMADLSVNINSPVNNSFFDTNEEISFYADISGGAGNYKCKWYSNNILLHSGCSSFKNIFTVAGSYDINLVVVDGNLTNYDKVSIVVELPLLADIIDFTNDLFVFVSDKVFFSFNLANPSNYACTWKLNEKLINTSCADFNYSFSNDGNYVVYLNYIDSKGVSKIVSNKITVYNKLNVNISSPSNNDSFFTSKEVSFKADISGGSGDYSCKWYFDAVLINSSCSDFSHKFSSRGSQDINLVVVDLSEDYSNLITSKNLSLEAYDSININISKSSSQSLPPIVASITSPINNYVNLIDTNFLFSGTITGGNTNYTCLWKANDSNINYSCSDFNYSFSSANDYNISLSVIDTQNNIGSTTNLISIRDPLSITFVSPSDDSFSIFSSQVIFDSTIDNNYGFYTCSWDSNLDGTGISSSCDFNTSNLSVGTHLITLSVTDDLETIDSNLELTIKTSLVPSIDSPSNDSTFAESNNINFVGSATNTSGSYSCSWSSSINNTFSSSCNVYTSSLSVGTHTITLSITDLIETFSKNITVTIVSGTPSWTSMDVGYMCQSGRNWVGYKSSAADCLAGCNSRGFNCCEYRLSNDACYGDGGSRLYDGDSNLRGSER